MLKVIGFDSREFKRDVIKKDGTKGKFRSALGVGVRVDNYEQFDKNYKENLKKIFEKYNLNKEYNYYCFNDLKNFEFSHKIIEEFILSMIENVEKIHVFYTLFSKKRIPSVKVYGRYSKREGKKLSKSTRNYFELLDEHIINMFPTICAWKICNCIPPTFQFHLDSYSGHINESFEELEKSSIKKLVFPSGDCINPVISFADLFLAFFDKRLDEKKLHLLFENIRKAVPEYGEKILAYPILNKHLPKITPLDKIVANVENYILRPIYWVFKGNVQVDSGKFKRSKVYRKLLDCISYKAGVVKLFSKMKDSDQLKDGDWGVFINDSGKETISTYKKLGIKLNILDLNLLVKEEDSNI